MKKQRILSPSVGEPAAGMWSNGLKVGDAVYISGLTSRAADGHTIEGVGEYEQCQIIFGKIRDLMVAAGGAMDDVVKMTIFVTNIGQNREVWRSRRNFFSGDFPACSLVEVSALATPEILVEIEAIGHVGCSTGSA